MTVGGNSPLHHQLLAVGLEGRVESEIRRDWTIAHYDPRLPAVLSTPAMIGMMEMAAARAVEHTLPVGKLTVGTRIEVDHTLAVSVGAHVAASARLVEIKDRYLIFEVEAHSGDLLIGKGRVTRTIVDYARFAQIASKGDGSSPAKS